MWSVGTDVGGTFTDLYAVNQITGATRSAKALTTPEDRAVGVMNALAAADIQPDNIGQLIHGTTTATNALIERTFPDAAMITTEGFRDVLEIGRMHREHLYRPYQTKPEPLIKRRYRFAIDERVTAQGVIETAVDTDVLAQIVDEIRRNDLSAVAVCLINSYVNSANEDAVAKYLRSELPQVEVVTSSEVKPVFREHTRFSTAVVRTVLLPVMKSYFRGLENMLKDKGFRGSLMILKSNGGMMSVEQARLRAEELVESGPAGGIGYASAISEMTGISNIIHTDVGGTSFDTSIVEDGKGLVTREYEIQFDIPVAVPMLDIRSVGAGGGSVGWIDEGGSLRVGPMSAGSVPGPACYGRGGERPTITDANLVLGRLNKDLGGKLKLDIDAARKAIASIGDPLGLSVEATAEGMIRVAIEAMGQAVKIVLASRGRDPRDYALASFGGAGPLHACALADVLAISKIVVPRFSGVASAFGATRLKLRHDEELFHFAEMNGDALPSIKRTFDHLKSKGLDALASQGVTAEEVSVSHVMRMRYAGQTFEVDVEQDAKDIANEQCDTLIEAFHKVHETEFGVRSEDFPVEVVALSITAESASPADTPLDDTRFEEPATTVREVHFDGRRVKTSICNAENLSIDQVRAGPLLLEDPHTIIVVPPGWKVQRDAHGNCILESAK